MMKLHNNYIPIYLTLTLLSKPIQLYINIIENKIKISFIAMRRINESSPNFIKPQRQHTPENKQKQTRIRINKPKLDLDQLNDFQHNFEEEKKKWPKSCKSKYNYFNDNINYQYSSLISFRLRHQKQKNEQKSTQKQQTSDKEHETKKVNYQEISPIAKKINRSYLKQISDKVKKDLKFNCFMSDYMTSRSNQSNGLNNFKLKQQEEQKIRQYIKIKQTQQKIFIQPFNLQKIEEQQQIKIQIKVNQVSKPQFKLTNFFKSSRKNIQEKTSLFKQFQESNRGQKQYIEQKDSKSEYSSFAQKENQIKTTNQQQFMSLVNENQKKLSPKIQELTDILVQKVLKSSLQKIIEPLIVQISKLNAKVEELFKQKHTNQILNKLNRQKNKSCNISQLMQATSNNQDNPNMHNDLYDGHQEGQQSKIHISISSQPQIKISCQKEKYDQFAFLQIKEIKHTDSFRVESNNFQEELNKSQKSGTNKSQTNYILDQSSEEEFFYQT